MNYQELKDFCNSLTAEQLKQEVYLSQVDGIAIRVGCGHITEKDQYFEHSDSLGTLEEIMNENPEDWKDIVDDAALCPKGTVMLTDEG